MRACVGLLLPLPARLVVQATTVTQLTAVTLQVIQVLESCLGEQGWQIDYYEGHPISNLAKYEATAVYT